MIVVKSAFSIKVQKKLDVDSILEAKTKKIRSKIVFKNMIFLNIEIYAFSVDFGSILGSKNGLKIANFRKN